MLKISSILDDKSPELFKLLQDISGQSVLVGIPEEKTGRKGDPVTNAQLMYIHTNGSEPNGIPARPVIEPAIEAHGNKEVISEELGESARSMMDGNTPAARHHLKRAGMAGQNAAREWFTDPRNGWVENSDATIAAKGSDRPLIDTGQLRKSIVYVVKDGK